MPGMETAPKVPASTFTTTLPSVVAAEKFVRGEPGGLMAVVSSTLGRAGIIFMGLFLAGERKHPFRYALAGAVAIETFVLLRIKNQLDEQKAKELTPTASTPLLP